MDFFVVLLIYGAVAIIPWIIVLLKKDLTNGLLIWILLVLFGVAVGKINLPMLILILGLGVLWFKLS